MNMSMVVKLFQRFLFGQIVLYCLYRLSTLPSALMYWRFEMLGLLCNKTCNTSLRILLPQFYAVKVRMQLRIGIGTFYLLSKLCKVSLEVFLHRHSTVMFPRGKLLRLSLPQKRKKLTKLLLL